MKKKNAPSILAAALLAAAFAATLLIPTTNAGAAKRGVTRIDWEAVESAEKYQVIVRNAAGAVVLDQAVESPYIDVTLPPGRYRIQVTPITKFSKPGVPSDLEEVEIIRKTLGERIRDGMYLRLAAGPVYSRVHPAWNEMLGDSGAGLSLSAGLYTAYGLWRFTGIDFEVDIVRYESQDMKAKLTDVRTGFLLALTTGPRHPLGLIARAGGGVDNSRLVSPSPVTGEQELRWANFPYWKAGGALEYRFPGAYTVEAGAYYTTVYQESEPMKTVDYFLRAGVRLGWEAAMQAEARGRRGEKEGKKAEALPLEFTLAAGLAFAQALPEWSDRVGFSFTGVDASLGARLYRGWMRHLGAELESSYTYLPGTGTTERLGVYTIGGCLYYTTDWKFPVDIVARLGAGLSVSTLVYTDPFTLGTESRFSEDPYFKAGLALRWKAGARWFVEPGGELVSVMYPENGLNMLRFFVHAGTRL